MVIEYVNHGNQQMCVYWLLFLAFESVMPFIPNYHDENRVFWIASAKWDIHQNLDS